ncbi:DUF4932 domain-containing protein [Romboutsia sp. 1001216sp1]|uniref:DUF4932 domain-containing protein n=1 Tax=Romboutsia sp. 1001216sp1 TaxID=2986997 RepID=UPI00232C1F6B|nr:DUF4932 domain-containing protein [Romboutsia sp. 1001216sp1]MDB8791037.1 DUF4932 domain-containing protein [Romboutsia sp. 1001216sp1]
MKKIISLLLTLTMIFSVGCSSPSEVNSEIIKENKMVRKEFNNINMTIDPRIELLSVIMYLSPTYDYKTTSIIPEDITYKQEVEKYFRKYKYHAVVKLFESMSKNGFSYDAPPTSMLYLTNPPNLKIREDIDKSDYVYTQCVQRAGGEDKFLEFIDELNNFVKESNFYEFYNDHMNYYEKIINTTIKSLSDIDYISQVEDYYGTKQNSYNIILNGMLYANNYGPRIKDKDGKYDIYFIQGSNGAKDDLPMFGDDFMFMYLIRHEFGHSFVNNLTTKNIKEVNKYESLFEPIKEKMNSQAYSNWETCLNEHLVRACVIRMTEIHNGKEDANRSIKMEKEAGFIYIDKLINLLEKEYEKNRDKYSTFEDFYPEILKLLDDLSNNKTLSLNGVLHEK